jgi:hypothetical protein
MPGVGSEVHARTVSEAWLGAIEVVDALPNDHAFHLCVHIAEPTVEIASVREIVDALLEKLRRPPIDEVRNTLFPAALAKRYPEPAELAARYRDRIYPKLKKLDRANQPGTYFLRMVDDPSHPGLVDQLSAAVDKLRDSHTGKRWKARYEVDMSYGLDLGIYKHDKDERKTRSFPCLSFCSFQLDENRVHMTANYRSQYLVQRAYGNYLALGQLLAYVASAAGYEPGELLVVAGHATIDAPVSSVRAAAASARAAID